MKTSPWFDPSRLVSPFLWLAIVLSLPGPSCLRKTLCYSTFVLCSDSVPCLCSFFSMYPNLSHRMRPTRTPLLTLEDTLDHLWPWWSPTHLHSYSIYSLNPYVAFSQELPLTCPVSLLNTSLLGEHVQYSLGLLPSSPWAFGSGGDLWSAVSRSEVNEVPDNGATPGSPQEFPVNPLPRPSAFHFLSSQPHLWIMNFPAGPPTLSLPFIQ